jgi:hypothetical protein
MIRRLALAILIAALVGVAPAARADGPNSATFVDLGPQGVLTLTALPGTQFVVRAEQADGTYATVWAGTMGLVAQARTLADTGPVGNGQPQYLIYFSWSGGSGSEVIAVDDPDEGWYWW